MVDHEIREGDVDKRIQFVGMYSVHSIQALFKLNARVFQCILTYLHTHSFMHFQM